MPWFTRSSSVSACTTSSGSCSAACLPSFPSRHSTNARRGRFQRRHTETDVALDLVPIWTVILAVSVFMYVLLDGFDLGVGILFPFAPDDTARDAMMGSVAP